MNHVSESSPSLELLRRCRKWGDGAGIVYVGMSPWHGMWRSRQQLMSRFAQALPVLYVEPWASLRKWKTGQIGLRDALRDFSDERVRKGPDRLHVYRSPAWLPIGGQGRVLDCSWRLWLLGLRRAMAEAGIRRPVLWVSRPEMRPIIGAVGEILSVYHIVDEFAGYTGSTPESAHRLWEKEARLLDSVDLSITTSPTIRDAKQAANRRIEVVENAVDFARFRKVAGSRERPPSDLAAIPSPRLGYSGLVGKRLDLEMLLEMARRRPDWSIVLVGRVDSREVEETLAAMSRCPNVYFLGQKPVEEVPAYIKGFDVALMPYRQNLETVHISPLKFYEYSAMGRPVVATMLPWTDRAAGLPLVAGSREQFIRFCSQAVEERSKEAQAARVAFAGENTWDDRVLTIAELITNGIAARETARPRAAGAAK